jgi:predicted ATPase
MQKTKNTPKHSNIQIAVENFGPIEKADVDLRPLTVFVGESNTGKTYLAALIYALYRTFMGFSRVPWPDDVILLLREIDTETLEALEKINTFEQSFKYSDLPQWLRTSTLSGLNNPEPSRDELKRCFNLDSISDLIRFTDSKKNEMKVLLKVSEENQALWDFEMKSPGADISVTGSVNEDMILCPEDDTISQKQLNLEDLATFLHVNRSRVPDFYYLPAPRGGIMETHGVILSSLVESATRVGLERSSGNATLSGMIADFLKQIINYDERRVSSDEMNGIAKILEDEVLRGEIVISRPTGGYPEFRYRPQNSEQALRMSHSSSMVSELAPLVLFLRSIVQLGDTVIIEEPEAHLHPAAQTKIALILARLVRVGVRVIITTHSDWLLEQIGNLVREGEVMKLGKSQKEPATWLTKEEVGAWLFRTDKPVQEIPFEHIAGIEPEEYGEVAEELYNRSVDLRTQLEETGGGTEVEQE